MKITQTIAYRLLLVAIVVSMCPDTFGQSLKPVPRSVNRAARQSTSGFRQRQTATRLVRAQESDLQLPEQTALAAPSAADLDRRRSEKKQRFRQIINRLKTLQDQLQQAKAAQAMKPDEQFENPSKQPGETATPPPSADEHRESGAATSELPETEAQEPPDRPAPKSPTALDTADSSRNVPPATSLDADVSKGTLEGIDLSSDVLVEGPVDRVALADNLYRVKEYKLAMEMYAQIDVRELSDDQQFWVQFQTASCHRQLGDLKAARTASSDRRAAGIRLAGAVVYLVVEYTARSCRIGGTDQRHAGTDQHENGGV